MAAPTNPTQIGTVLTSHSGPGGEDSSRATALAAGVPGGEAVVLPEPPAPTPAPPTGHAAPRPEAPVPLPTTPGRAKAALVALGAAAFIVVTNEIAPLGLISVMAADLGRTEQALGLATTVFATVVMISTLPLARLTTRLPRRTVLVWTLAVWSLGALIAALSHSFEMLLAARVVTALAHAVFWAVVTPAAAGMFPPAIRGRSVSRLLLGASAAGVVGLPAETWLAQRTSWQTPFAVLAVAGVVLAVAIRVLMPSFRTEEGTAARGELPSLRRFVRILGVTILTTGGMATTFTFITPFAIEVTGFSASAVPVLLFVGGAVGVVSMLLVARYLDRWPVKAVAFGLGLLIVMWVGLSVGGSVKVIAVAMIAVQGFAWSIVVAAMVNWAMRHSPWASDIGVGAYASTFNAGNAVGSVAGAALLGGVGAAWLPGASLVVTVVALALVVTSRPLRSMRLPGAWARAR